MKPRIAVALYHRDHLSRGHTRKILGYESYHWGISIMPTTSDTQGCHAFEATDVSEIDPVTWRMGNPAMDWWFRAKRDIDPAAEPKLLGRVVVGAAPEGTSARDLEELFRGVPLPVKNTHPQQSCVSWTLDAVRAVQDNGWASRFDVDEFKDWALEHADGLLRGEGDREKVVRYPRV